MTSFLKVVKNMGEKTRNSYCHYGMDKNENRAVTNSMPPILSGIHQFFHQSFSECPLQDQVLFP